MTREDAIELLDDLIGFIEDNQGRDYDKAFRMAIESLSAEPSGDLISRAEATSIPFLPKEHRRYQTMNIDDAYEQGWCDLEECIQSLPSADRHEYNLETIADIVRQLGHLDSYIADRPKGEWKTNQTYKTLVYCSECGMAFKDSLLPRNYCPRCGAEMK